MTPHEWHVLASFGLLVGAVSLIDGKTAMLLVGVAAAVVTVRNANKITEVLV
jgi:hypothetical protein